MRVALVGAGNIADRYAEAIGREDELELAGATDTAPGRAAALVGRHGGVDYPDLAALLADERVDAVVNLTVPHAHAEVTETALRAGKHVHSEKPLALAHAEADSLVRLAREQGVALASAPATLLGEAQQTAWKLVREGAVGCVRVVYAEANWGRIESWHPEPAGLYAVGPLVDVGIYPLTILTAVLGPVRRVSAAGATVEPERVTLAGDPFRLDRPDVVVATFELAGGVLVRLTASFYVGPSKQRGIELHGDSGSLYLATWGEADSRLELQRRGGEYESIPLVREAFHGIDWGRSLVDLAHAVEEGRRPRSSGEHAAHVVEAIAAAERSLAEGRPVEVVSGFEPPPPLEWAR